MEITPSSSRALRQRLWTLFTTYSTSDTRTLEDTPQGAHSSSRTLTREGFRTAIDALVRRSTFRGLFIGSEDDAAIRNAAAEIQTAMALDALWKAAVAQESRRSPPRSVVDGAIRQLSSNDHFAEEDFFGEVCYQGNGYAGGTVPPATTSSFLAETCSEDKARVSWASFDAAVVLRLYHHHRFVHSFLASEIAALSCGSETAEQPSVVEAEQHTARTETLSSNGIALPSNRAMKAAALPSREGSGRAAPDVVLRSQPVRIAAPQQRRDTSGTNFLSSLSDPPVVVPRRCAMELPPSPPPPRLATPAEPPSRPPCLCTPVGPVRTSDVAKPSPPPLRKHTQREAAELANPHPADTPLESKEVEASAAECLTTASSLPQSVAVPPPKDTRWAGGAGERRRAVHGPPVVSCPSVSVSVSSSSSCGAVPRGEPAPTRVLCVPRRRSSASPPPRRPESAESAAVTEVAHAESARLAMVVNAAPRIGGLRLCSPSELNTAQAFATKKSSSRSSQNKEHKQTAQQAADACTDVSESASEAIVRRPKLARATGKQSGQRRLYTTRRPHTVAAAAAGPGSGVPQGFAQRRVLTEAWPGRPQEASIELEAPPTTRHEDAPSPSQRTPSPLPCIPPSEEDWGQDGRSGTVEHAVEGRRTTALQVHVVDSAMAVRGTHGRRASAWRVEEMRDASPIKPAPLSPSRDAPEQQQQQPAPVPPAPELPQSFTNEYEVATFTEQPPTQTSRRRTHQHHLEPQPSPFSTTREPYALASEITTWYTRSTAGSAPRSSSAAATLVGEGRRTGAPAAARVTAPSPTPTPREDAGDSTARRLSVTSVSSPRETFAVARGPEPSLTVPPPQSESSRHVQRPQKSHRHPTRAPSPPLLIGVPRILSSTFTSPLVSARASLGSATPRQHSDDAFKAPQQHLQRLTGTATPTDTPTQREASEAACRTPPRHWSPEALERLSQTPASLLSSVVHLRHAPPSPATPSQRHPQRQVEVTTPPPRLSHRARVRSSSCGDRAVPTPPRVPRTRMQMSPTGSLQVTPRRRAPSTSSLA